MVTRRAPQPFQIVDVVQRVDLTPRMIRLTLEGDVFATWTVTEPGASFRMVVPRSSSDALELPEWNGNEFLLADETRPALRTFTPLRLAGNRMDVEIVRHAGGAISQWAEHVEPGAIAAVSGTGAGYWIDPEASSFLILGDETAIPAIRTVLASLPRDVSVEVVVEVLVSDAHVDLPAHPNASVRWVEQADRPGWELVRHVEQRASFKQTDRVWAAGEAAAMQGIRKHLKSVGVGRSSTHVRGYWKVPRTPAAGSAG